MDGESPVPDLVLAARTGHQDAWNSLVERFTPLALSVVRRYRLQRTDAEDVVQTLWLRLVEHLGEIRDPQALPGWIVTTAKNECLRVIKGHQRSEPFDPLDSSAGMDIADGALLDETVLETMARQERQQVLLAAFAALPDRQRDLLQLLLTDPPLGYAEISRRLGIPIGSIGPTRARALERIRKLATVARLL